MLMINVLQKINNRVVNNLLTTFGSCVDKKKKASLTENTSIDLKCCLCCAIFIHRTIYTRDIYTMILGQGIDIVEIKRISEAIERSGTAFLERVYTKKELAEAHGRKKASAAYFAGRWAAKEACAKALGCGIGKNCALTDIEILKTESGAPALSLSGRADAFFRKSGGKRVHVSISHEENYAVSTVIIEA